MSFLFTVFLCLCPPPLLIVLCMCVCAKMIQLCPTLWTAACQAPLSMGFSRQKYWNGLPCPPPGDLPNSKTEPESLMPPALAGRFFTTSTTSETPYSYDHILILENAHIYLFFLCLSIDVLQTFNCVI